MKFLVVINIKSNDYYDILQGGSNYVGHTFVMEEDMTEEELKENLIKILNKMKINFINVKVFETQDKIQKILNFQQVKLKLKRGLLE